MNIREISKIISENNTEALARLLSSGFDPNEELCDEDECWFSPLPQAVYKKALACAEMLVRAGAKDPVLNATTNTFG